MPLLAGRSDAHCHPCVNVPPRTFTTEWQCETYRLARSPPSGSVCCTATRPQAYRSHCHSAPSVPLRYDRHRVAVYGALPLGRERTSPHVQRNVAVPWRRQAPPIADRLPQRPSSAAVPRAFMRGRASRAPAARPWRHPAATEPSQLLGGPQGPGRKRVFVPSARVMSPKPHHHAFPCKVD